MAWIITKDHCSKGTDLDKTGNGQWGEENVESGQPPMGCFPYSFRLKSDDGDLSHEGRYDADAVTGEDEGYGGLYEALRFGEWDAGSPILEVKAAEYVALVYGSNRQCAGRTYVEEHTDKDGWYVPYG